MRRSMFVACIVHDIPATYIVHHHNEKPFFSTEVRSYFFMVGTSTHKLSRVAWRTCIHKTNKNSPVS